MASSSDALINQVLDLFSRFSLEKLDNEWVTNVIEADFTEVEEIPAAFEDTHSATNFGALFHAQLSTLRQWVDVLPLPNPSDDKRKSASIAANNTSMMLDTDELEERDMLSKFWVDLAKISKIKNLMAFVFYYVHTGQRYDAKEEDRDLGIQAASLYFLLLCIPGSNAFRVFHPVLYLKSLDLLRLTTKLHVGVTSPRKGRGGGVGGSGPSRGQRTSADERPASRAATNEDDDEDGDLTLLSPQEANKLTRMLNILLSDFIRLMQRFSLKHSPESLDETISILVEVTRSETHNAHAVFLGRPGASTVTSLVYNSYVALQCICGQLHGNIRKIVTLVLKHILCNILMVSRGTSDLSLRALGVIRDHSVIFVKYLLTQIKEPAYDGVYILVQHLCLQVPDKADFRQKTSQSIVEILRHLPIQLYTRLMKWFFKFSHNEKAGHRLFTLEIISKMLGEDERHAEDGQGRSAITTPVIETNAAAGSAEVHNVISASRADPSTSQDTLDCSFNIMPVDHSVAVPANRNILSHKFLLGIIFSRCRDSAATVRSKALALLAECTLSDNPTIGLAMKQIFSKKQPLLFTTPHIDNNEVNIESPIEDLQQQPQGEAGATTPASGGGEHEGGEREEDDESAEMKMPNAAMVMSLLRRRARDDKVTVRKSALQVMENLMKLDQEMVSKANLKVLTQHCRDPALLVRKQMMSCLTQLVERYPALTAEAWVTGVLPAILDPEMKVQEKVVEMLHQVVLGRLVASARRDAVEHNQLPWLLLSTVSKLSFHKFLNKAIFIWGNSPLAKPQLLDIAKSHIRGEHNEQTWLLLSILSHCLPLGNAMFAVTYYHDNCASADEVGWFTLQLVLRTLSNCVTSVPLAACEDLQEALLAPLTHGEAGAGLISPSMDLLALINDRLHGEEKEGEVAMEAWVSPLLVSCDEYMQSVLFAQERAHLDPQQEERLFRCIFLLGEAGLLWPSGVNKRMFLMLQSIIFQSGAPTGGATSPPPQTIHPPSSQTQSSQPPRLNFVPSKRIQAVSVAVLGKLCLPHESQAKRIIPALGRMLDTNPGPDIKTNIIFTLSDMCVRYATVVDPLMPQVTACLRDPDLAVRRTTLTLLISLLQEDYLKLKGSFFYRILQCLCDVHEEMRDTVIFFLTERLLKRFPKIFSQHFIECIFHYNCYEEHESYNRFSQNQQEKELFSLAGADHFDARMSIYKFMLEHMADDQRFSITQRLCHDVLGGVVDGRMGAAGCNAVLRDTLLVLSCDEIKLASLKARPEEDQATCQEEQAQIAGLAIKKTIISQVVKRNVIENIVPILIALKHKLEQQRSPLMKQLLLYLKEIMRDYKNEVKEILAGDKQLAEEIEFDLRKFEERQREEEEEQRRAELARAKAEKQKKLRPPGRGGEESGLSLQADAGQSPSLLSSATADNAVAVLARSRHDDDSSDGSMLGHAGDGSGDEDDDDNGRYQRGTKSTFLNQSGASSSLETSMGSVSGEGLRLPRVSIGLERMSTQRINSVKKNLLKTAVLNSQRIASRRQSLCTDSPVEEGPAAAETSPKVKAALQMRRARLSQLQDTGRRLSTVNESSGAAPSDRNSHEEQADGSSQLNAREVQAGCQSGPDEVVASGSDGSNSHANTNSNPNNEAGGRMSEYQTIYTSENVAIDEGDQAESGEVLPPSDLQAPLPPSDRAPAPLSQEQRRQELLRAISTPTRNQSIIRNLTFMNQTQEMSAIGVTFTMNASASSAVAPAAAGSNASRKDGDGSQETILLHLNSPAAFAKDEEFSRLRRSTKRSLNTTFQNELRLKNAVAKDAAVKRPSGGLFESFEETPSDGEQRREGIDVGGISGDVDGAVVNKNESQKKSGLDDDCRKQTQQTENRTSRDTLKRNSGSSASSHKSKEKVGKKRKNTWKI